MGLQGILERYTRKTVDINVLRKREYLKKQLKKGAKMNTIRDTIEYYKKNIDK